MFKYLGLVLLGLVISFSFPAQAGGLKDLAGKSWTFKVCNGLGEDCYKRKVNVDQAGNVTVIRRSGSSWGDIQSSRIQNDELIVKIAQVRKNVPRVISLVLNLETGKVLVFGPQSGGRDGMFQDTGKVDPKS